MSRILNQFGEVNELILHHFPNDEKGQFDLAIVRKTYWFTFAGLL